MPRWSGSFSFRCVVSRCVVTRRSRRFSLRRCSSLVSRFVARRSRRFSLRRCSSLVSRFVASFLVASLLVAPVVSRCVVARRSVLVDRSFIAARRFSRCSLIGLLGPRLLVARSSSTVRLSLLLGPRMPSQRIRGIYPLFPLIR